MKLESIQQYINQTWDQSIVPLLSQYIAIPCKSVAFDPDWQKHGYLDQAIQLLADWCLAQKIPNLQLVIHRLPGRTPLLLIEIPGEFEQTVLLYGHMDKQPEMVGWQPDLSPWEAVLKEGRLYGRGGADDGYAVCAAITAIKALKEQNIPHAHCIILIEASEESGSVDLPFYLDHLKKQISTPDLVICLDSSADTYEQLWCTTSLRGIITLKLTVEILTEGVHSGAASGVVPSSFRILRQLLSRIENENTGDILLKELQVNIPKTRRLEAKKTADTIHDAVWTNYPWVKNAHPAGINNELLILSRTWLPTLAIIGMNDIPSFKDAGNVLRPKTSAMLSIRIPPTCEPKLASIALKKTLETNPPYHAKISAEILQSSAGWNAPPLESWLATALENASDYFFKNPVMYKGEGGSIPFISMLAEKFPQAQFMITGVLGPHSNAHGPNEFLDIEMGKKVTACVALVMAMHAKRRNT